MFISLSNYTLVALLSFTLAIAGIFLNRKNMIILLMCIELLLLSINLLLVTFSAYLDDAYGFIFTILIITVAAAESAIGLAILVSLYNVRKTVSIQFINLMKG